MGDLDNIQSSIYDPYSTMSNKEYFFKISCNSEVFTLELLENPEEMFDHE